MANSILIFMLIIFVPGVCPLEFTLSTLSVAVGYFLSFLSFYTVQAAEAA